MKKFLNKILVLLLLTIGVLLFSLFFIPDVVSRTSILAALIDKHEVLKKIKTEKIIFVGGSNVSFGLDSKKIMEKYNRSVINMGLHAGIGLEFIVKDAKQYINKGDIIVLIPEYENFYTDNFYGEMELIAVLFDIEPQGRKLVDAKQWQHLLKYIPTYSAKKIKNYIPTLFRKQTQATEVNIYDRRSFNEFGDAYIHWALPNQNYLPAKINTGKEKLNIEVVSFIKEFKKYVISKGATVCILPPVIQDQSFNNQVSAIYMINDSLTANNISFFVKPERYKFSSEYFFNSYYHLNKKGVDERTQMIIQDIDKFITK